MRTIRFLTAIVCSICFLSSGCIAPKHDIERLRALNSPEGTSQRLSFADMEVLHGGEALITFDYLAGKSLYKLELRHFESKYVFTQANKNKHIVALLYQGEQFIGAVEFTDEELGKKFLLQKCLLMTTGASECFDQFTQKMVQILGSHRFIGKEQRTTLLVYSPVEPPPSKTLWWHYPVGFVVVFALYPVGIAAGFAVVVTFPILAPIAIYIENKRKAEWEDFVSVQRHKIIIGSTLEPKLTTDLPKYVDYVEHPSGASYLIRGKPAISIGLDGEKILWMRSCASPFFGMTCINLPETEIPATEQ